MLYTLRPTVFISLRSLPRSFFHEEVRARARKKYYNRVIRVQIRVSLLCVSICGGHAPRPIFQFASTSLYTRA